MWTNFLSSPSIHAFFSPESLEVHSPFTWVGQTQYKLQLKPRQVLCLSLQACFLQAGVYNLNTLRVFAKPAEQDTMCETSQQTANPALIIISNAWMERHSLLTGGPGFWGYSFWDTTEQSPPAMRLHTTKLVLLDWLILDSNTDVL